MKIQEKIDEYILSQQEKREYSGKISASGLGHCYRKQYWNINREEPSNPLEPRVLRVFKCGDLFHDFVQNIILESSDDMEVEVPYTDDVVSLRVDMVDKDTVYEIKSVHSRSFWHMKKSEEPITKQKYENVLQACMGALYLDKKYIHIIWVSKDDLCVFEIHMEVTDEWKEAVRAEVKAVSSYLLEKTLPPASPRLWIDKNGKSKECGFCKFKDKCKEAEDEKQKTG